MISPAPKIDPSNVTLMVKPVGAMCNLECTYCYYLPTQAMYGGHERRMSLDTLESVFAGFLPHAADEVTIAWQGGEPTLAGLAFFEQAVAFQKRYARRNQFVSNSLQTNGTLLDEAWCHFLRDQQFLVGISIDGSAFFHDHYRLDRRGRGTHQRVMHGLELLRTHGVEHNILTVLNQHNVHYPKRLFRELLRMSERWLQFIPAIEWIEDGQGRPQLAPFSPTGPDFGRFLCEVFDLWFEHHRYNVSVRLFDVVLNQLVFGQSPLCIMGAGCHNQVTVEHNGDVFGCDHFVQREWQLGQVNDNNSPRDRVALTVGQSDQPAGNAPAHDAAMNRDAAASTDHTAANDQWYPSLATDRLGQFSARKQHLGAACTGCPYLRFCYGGCPKHRPHRGDAPEASVLCAGYRMFFEHGMDRMEWMAGYLRQGYDPPRQGPPDRAVVTTGADHDRQPPSRPRARHKSRRNRSRRSR